VESVEGFLAHFVARDSLARALAAQQAERNTDDRTLIEFGFARGLSSGRFNLDEIVAAMHERRFPGSRAVVWRPSATTAAAAIRRPLRGNFGLGSRVANRRAPRLAPQRLLTDGKSDVRRLSTAPAKGN